jgi:type II secretory pathway pseudopilin PulG/predicted NAD-dependent protein-ADP-ribosyltransferase YbiA (DUF1768 family)
MMKQRQRSLGRNQRGVVLIGLVALLVVGGLYFYLSNLSPEMIQARRQQLTAEALAQAREALIGYAVRYRETQQAKNPPQTVVYGYLPLPDLGSMRNNNQLTDTSCYGKEGCEAYNFLGNGINTTVIGRFPWRTLGTGPLRDAHGECLWYAVSGSHQRNQPDPTRAMNWDTLSQLDIVVANSTTAMVSAITSAHDRPIAVIFSPGPSLAGQDRSASVTDNVAECGGNYVVSNYLDPAVAANLGGVTNYLAGANGASENTSVTNKALSANSVVNRRSDGALWVGNCPPNDPSPCAIVANDTGVTVTSELLFRTLRGSSYFRTDVNAMLDRMVGCLRDQFAAGGNLTLDANSANLQGIAGDKVAGRIPANDPCYGDGIEPKGYFTHYKELVFVAKPNSGAFSVNGQSCAGTALFASQRGPGQMRITTGSGNEDKNKPSNYLEGDNFTSFTNSGANTFSGADKFERVSSTQSASQDIVRCIPSGASLVTTPSPGLAAAGLSQIASYSPSTGTLTLGREVAASLPAGSASDLFGCAWTPETHAMNGGLRSYFSFRINDSGFSSSPLEGFTFAIVDGDNNRTNACGAARQHLGYSGNNLDTPFIVAPKIAMEIDLRRQGTFNPTSSNTLSNGRNDPSYSGGHVAIDYWGGETSILATGTATGTFPPCTAPRVTVGSNCYLPQEEDDNVHGQPANTRIGFPAPPANPSAPATPLDVPPDAPAGVYKLDPGLNSVPISTALVPLDIHVRVELNRAAATFSLPTVRAATTANLNLVAPGTAVDGVSLAANDRVLVKDQTAPAENGIYVWNGALSAMNRATDADTAGELVGSIVEVQQGAQQARSIWRQASTNPTLGTDPLRWANVRVKLAPQSNIDLASPGATLDGIMMAAGDRVLVKAQTVTTDNGIYLWNGASSVMTRALDADTAAKLTDIVVQVQQGSDATAWWRYDGASWSRLSVRVATQSAINLASPGAGIDGITLAAGDRVLVKAQAISAENGIYIWNGSSSAMTRATDADTAAKLAGALTHVLAGTDTGRAFRQTALAATGTLDTNSVQWTAIDPSPKFLIEIWILPSNTETPQIVAMKNTTRPMSVLYPTFVPHLRDAPTISYPFRNARLGFTIGQRTSVTDQTFSITNFFTTWLD